MNSRFLKYVQSAHILKAVSKHGSFSAAAKALGVQQSAISHRIKTLEDALGTKLYRRSTRVLAPTEAGEHLIEAASTAIDDMLQAWSTVHQQVTGSTIRIASFSSLTTKWIIPLMMKAQSAGLEIDLKVQEGLTDFAGGDADVGIRFGCGPYPGLHHELLHKVVLQPVASPRYLKRNGFTADQIGDQSMDILVDRIAEDERSGFRWVDYLAAVNNNNQKKRSVIKTDRTDLSLLSAINGLGVSLGRSFLVEDDIKDGFLVAVDRPVPIRASYWLVCTHDFARTHKFKKLSAWLREQIETGDYL